MEAATPNIAYLKDDDLDILQETATFLNKP
jgi:hypothetical protein